MLLDRKFVVSFLELNKVSESSSFEKIKETFIKAKWTDAEIARALELLQDPTHRGSVTGHNNKHIFTPRTQLTSHRVSYLLGVDVSVDPTTVRAPRDIKIHKEPKTSVSLFFTMAILAALLALVIGIGGMYFGDVGVFYAS